MRTTTCTGGCGRTGIATSRSELAKRTVQMVGIGGVREFFNPYDGTGQGAIDFG